MPTSQFNPSDNSSKLPVQQNCLLKSLISSTCAKPFLRKFCKLTDGCRKPVSGCGSATTSGNSSKTCGTKIKTEPQDAQDTTNKFINQIIRDTVDDRGLATGCQQLRTLPPSSSANISTGNVSTCSVKSYREKIEENNSQKRWIEENRGMK